jgi:hypothetical protein
VRSILRTQSRTELESGTLMKLGGEYKHSALDELEAKFRS